MSKKYQHHKHEGLGQVYRKCIDAGYKRSYESMCKKLRKLKSYEKPKKISYPKRKYDRYSQITAIDLYSRKRVFKLVNEHSSYGTAKMLMTLEKEFGFKIKTVQNGVVERSHKIYNKLFYSRRVVYECSLNFYRRLCRIWLIIIEELRKNHLIELEKRNIKSYNDVEKISEYALEKFKSNEYDEVYTEYRVTEILRRDKCRDL